MPPPRKLHDHVGRPIDLGPQLAAGGEGVVCAVAGDAAAVAKVYHRRPDAAHAEKLAWMVQTASPELCKFAAWPTATLHDGVGGPLAGFVMPRFNGYRAVHTLYSPAHRRTTFPQADWAFLVHTAMNCASAFDAVHSRGHVVGDVNQSNVLVSKQALVCLIDCDSFQVHAGGRVFPCEVGVLPYTPPELQGHSFRGVVRTPNHDRFGLAVLVFHLLFMGRHPYAGRFLGSGEMPLEQAIKENRFVYARTAVALQMAPPPNTLALAHVSPELAGLFERAFGCGADARPAAAEWQAALAAFGKQFRACADDPGHKIPANLVECPWCAVMKAGGPNFFLGVGLGGAVFAVDLVFLGRTWQRIEAVSQRPFAYHPPAIPTPQQITPAPGASQLQVMRKLSRIVNDVCWVTWFGFALSSCLVMWGGDWLWRIALVSFGIWLVFRVALFFLHRTPSYAEEGRRKRALHAVQMELNAAVAEWQQVAARYWAEFSKLKGQLKKLKDKYQKLQAEYDAERPNMEANKAAYFRDQFLKTRFLSDYKIDKIGANRQVLLASYGVETAFDVTKERLAGIKGIGRVLAGNLLAWRKKIEAEFRFDPQAVVPESEVRGLVLKYQQREEALKRQLQQGAAELEALAGRTEEQLRAVYARIEALALRVAQAEADVKVLSP